LVILNKLVDPVRTCSEQLMPHILLTPDPFTLTSRQRKSFFSQHVHPTLRYAFLSDGRTVLHTETLSAGRPR
jgi:hypothetical protein